MTYLSSLSYKQRTSDYSLNKRIISLIQSTDIILVLFFDIFKNFDDNEFTK